MAINIFSGGAAKSANKAPRVSSAAERASATTAAITGPAVASDSGSTAVKPTGILGKIGSLVGKVAPVLGNILPGPFGMIAKTIGNLASANDPEWWETVKGDGLTVNSPLTIVPEGSAAVPALSGNAPINNIRPTFLDFVSASYSSTLSTYSVMSITPRMATQYVMPAVRKVTNAVVMQDASTYASVFEAQATMYALWRNLKKYDYFIKHGYTFVANLNDPAFPVLQVANAAWLQSTITRLEEYLHSHVRLPHTLCEYLSWRYGRVFRTNSSAKAGFVCYNVLPMTALINTYNNLIEAIQTYCSASDQIQKAVSDLYNAYADHDQDVLMTDASMVLYDTKEFCLRTNLDVLNTVINPWTGVDAAPVIIDSNLDNPTVFMASTVSTMYDNTGVTLPLFPVDNAHAYLARGDALEDFIQYYLPTDATGTSAQASSGWLPIGASTTWLDLSLEPTLVAGKEIFTGSNIVSVATFFSALHVIEACKALDIYNFGVFFAAKRNSNAGASSITFLDQTSISMDMGSVPDLVIANEQVIAFANLVTEVHKDAQTYKSVEKRAAKDVANFIENNEVAAMSK